jgi:hypothetical protein
MLCYWRAGAAERIFDAEYAEAEKAAGDRETLVYPRPRRSCRAPLDQHRQPHQIIGGGGEGERPSDAIGAAKSRLALTSHGLHPAESFLDALPDT